MFPPFLLPFIVAQGADSNGPANTLTVYTASQTSDGASFSVRAITTPIPGGTDPYHNSYSGGVVSGTTSVFTSIGSGFNAESTRGSASQSATFDFYLAGKYSGDPAALPTSASYSVPKSETGTATCQAAVAGNSATGSTSNTSVHSQDNQGVKNATPFSNTVSGTANSLGWQLQPDGSYSSNYYLFSNTLSTSATYANIGVRSVAGTNVKVTFSLGSVSASH